MYKGERLIGEEEEGKEEDIMGIPGTVFGRGIKKRVGLYGDVRGEGEGIPVGEEGGSARHSPTPHYVITEAGKTGCRGPA